MPLPKNYILTLTTIRYLGWLGEALALYGPSGEPKPDAVAEASRCCDRIEHIAQYALESMEWKSQALFLTRDVTYMKSVLDHFETVFKSGRNLVPSAAQINELQIALAASVET